jgi:hypothetical protein
MIDVPELLELVPPPVTTDIRAALTYRPAEVVRLGCPVFASGSV